MTDHRHYNEWSPLGREPHPFELRKLNPPPPHQGITGDTQQSTESASAGPSGSHTATSSLPRIRMTAESPDPRTTGALPLSRLRSWFGRWHHTAFRGANPRLRTLLLENDDEKFLEEISPAQRKYDVTGEDLKWVISNQMRRSRQQSGDTWVAFNVGVCGTFALTLIPGAAILTGLVTTLNQRNRCENKLRQVLQTSSQTIESPSAVVAMNAKRAEGDSDTPSTGIALFMGETDVDGQQIFGVDLVVTPSEVGQTDAGSDSGLGDSQEDLYQTLKRCASLGAEYFAAFDDASKTAESVYEDPVMAAKLRELEMPLRQCLDVWASFVDAVTGRGSVEGETGKGTEPESA